MMRLIRYLPNYCMVLGITLALCLMLTIMLILAEIYWPAAFFWALFVSLLWYGVSYGKEYLNRIDPNGD